MFKFLFKSWFIKSLILINFLGTVWGFWWYHLQLAETPLKWWIFVPDSPLSSGFFTVALLLYINNKKTKWFHLAACFLSIKYGVWAAIVLSDFWLHGGVIKAQEIMLWISHASMAVEGLIYLFLVSPQKYSSIPFIIFTWLNDIADYFFSKHPYFFYHGQERLGMFAAFSLSLLLTIAAVSFSFSERGIKAPRVNLKGLER